MNILILGSGAREHAIAWKIRQSLMCDQLFVAPGNAGTAQLGSNVSLDPNNSAEIAAYLLQENIGMLIIGPEAPLVSGLVDKLRSNKELSDVKIIGPDQNGAQLEGSKSFAKAFMKEFNIPTAEFREFDSNTLEDALSYIDEHETPIVLKADGLAAGKGVLICTNREEAKKECREMLSGKFGKASEKLVIEEFMDGIEFSVFLLTDGKDYQILPLAKDYKRVGEGDNGLNTGGMGAVSPVPFVDDDLMEKVITRIIEPTMQGIQERGMDYRGFVFLGLMNVQGNPKVVEYNCRMGDPETQVVMSRLNSDLVEHFEACAQMQISSSQISVSDQYAVCTVLASGGYPESYEKGKLIHLNNIDDHPGINLFHAGTIRSEGKLLTNGGRVLSVVGKGSTFAEAKKHAQEGAKKIEFELKYYRSDIGFDLDEN